MPNLTPAPYAGMLDALHDATAEHGPRVRDYMIGALAARLESIPEGPEAWAAALETSVQIAGDMTARVTA